jgi:NTE family protein
MTMNINKQNCGSLPTWIDAAMKDRVLNRRKTDALAALSYRASDRLYAHLLDGGISDNLGLRGPFQAVTTNDSAWSILNQTNRKHLKQLMVIAVNAKTTKHSDWDKTSKPPCVTQALGGCPERPHGRCFL